MTLLIFGTRTFDDIPLLEATLKQARENTKEVVSGGANGADHLGELWAIGYSIPLTRFPADWDKYGKGAGPKRNQQMLEHLLVSDKPYAVCFWDGESRGTRDMLNRLRGKVKTWVVQYDHTPPKRYTF